MNKIVLILCFLFIKYYGLSQNSNSTSGSLATQSSENTRYWIEYPDGSFKFVNTWTSPSTFGASSEHLVLLVNLYDTGKGGPPPSVVQLNTVQATSTFNPNQHNNDPVILPGQKKIIIDHNVRELVAGDMMVFVLTYNTGLIQPQSNVVTTFTAYFFYNQAYEADFFNMAGLGNFNNTNLPTIRTHNGEISEVGLTSSLALANINGINQNLINSYKYYIALKNIQPSEYEKNVFLTLLPDADIIEGTSTSVLGVLTKTKDSMGIINEKTYQDQFLLEGLPVSLAHDPNYLKVKPACIESTKRGGHKIEYILHFQNTGPGPADTVLVNVQMPRGVDLKNFGTSNISRAVYAGIDFKKDLDLITVDEVNNILGFKFDPGKLTDNSTLLMGTDFCINYLTDSTTMGDIVFSVLTTDAADSVLNAHASIEFHSKYAGANSKYELPVITNTATVRIKECCDCSKCSCDIPTCCYIIAGLCWWWWVIIFLILTAIYVFLRRRKKAALC